MKQRKRKFSLKPGVAEKIVKGEPVADDASDLTNQELFGDNRQGEALDESDTDESANEGVGNGTIGRSTRNPEE